MADETPFIETRGGQFLAGLGIGAGAFIAVRFGPQLIARAIPGVVVRSAPVVGRWLVKKATFNTLKRATVGEVHIPSPAVEHTVAQNLESVATVVFWLWAGNRALNDHLADPNNNGLRPADQVVGEDNSPWQIVESEAGSIGAVMVEAQGIDP